MVMKRTVSDECRHVYEHVSLTKRRRNRKENQLFKRETVPDAAELRAFPHLVQPFVSAFQESPEYRMYVLNGEVLFGLESRWSKKEAQLQYSHLDVLDDELKQATMDVAAQRITTFWQHAHPATSQWGARFDEKSYSMYCRVAWNVLRAFCAQLEGF